MNSPRLRSRHPAGSNRRRPPERPPAWALPPHPFRYALIATLGVGMGTAILGGIGALGTVLVYLGIAFFLALAVEPLLQTALRRGVPRWIAVVALALILLLSAAFVGTVIVPAVSSQLATLAEDAIAIVTFIVTAAAGSPAPALLALIAFVGALIPVVGPVIGASIAALITLDTGLIPAIIVAAILFAYLQVEAYILTPRVMAHAVAMPGALVIVAALGGAALGGILGALVAVPIAAAGVTIINRVVIPHQQQQR